jgi:uncharacterized membrane protein
MLEAGVAGAPESQDAINQREWESSWNWSASGFYSSKADNRLWVPKRPLTGSGQAINLAHPGAKMLIASLLIVPAIIIVVVVALAVYAN